MLTFTLAAGVDMRDVMLRGAKLVAAVLGASIAGATVVSAVKTVVVPRAESQRITRLWFLITRRLFGLRARSSRPFADRDRVMALYAPLTLVLLPILWTTCVTVGFTGIYWAVTGDSLRDAFLTSGSSMFTLGVVFHRPVPLAALTFFQAALGLTLTALLISYLPSIYGAYQRREQLVGMLDSRAGVPPTPSESLIRYQRISGLDQMDDDLFARWEEWFVDVEESHSSVPALVYFRSPRADRSWITAAGCVLDTAAIYLSCVDIGRSARASLCLRSGFLALRRLTDYFKFPVDHDPQPTDPISVTRAEFDDMFEQLRAAEVPLVADVDQAWADYAGWRVNYDVALVALCQLVMAPEGRWSSDRLLLGNVPKRPNWRGR